MLSAVGTDGVVDGRAFPRAGESVAAFVARVPPSTAVRSGTLQWIQVDGPKERQGEGYGEVAGMVREIKDELEEYRRKYVWKGSTVPKKVKDEVMGSVYAVASRHRVTEGKWMLRVEPARADDAWRKVAGACVAGALGCAAKISPCVGGLGFDDRALICVYCADFNDRADCRRVLEGIRALALTTKVTGGFKADALTIAELYQPEFAALRLNNAWQLHVDILRDVYPLPQTKKSSVKGHNLAGS